MSDKELTSTSTGTDSSTEKSTEKKEKAPEGEEKKEVKEGEEKKESIKEGEEKKEAIKENTPTEVEAIIKRVSEKKDEWAKLSVEKRLGLLRAVRERLTAEESNWLTEGAKQTGYDLKDPKHAHLVAEVLAKGPAMMGAWLNALENTYNEILKTGLAPRPLATRKISEKRQCSQVFPWGVKETVFANGSSVHVYTEGAEISQFNPLKLPGGVTGVLGAGNFDCPNDVLHSLFLENKVVIHKANPVVARSSAVIQRVLAPLVDAGYLGFIYGGPEAGKVLIGSSEVESLMMTGSCRTYDAIVWEDKKKSKKKMTKPFKAELGSVNPYIIVPGAWSDAELEAHAHALVCAKMFNNGHVCASPQVVLTCKNWPLRDKLLTRVRELLKLYPGTRPYYPHCNISYESHLKALTSETKKGADDLIVKNPKLFEGQQHPLFATDVQEDAFATREEAFTLVLTEHPLDTKASAQEFLPAAVKFVNERLWGSLSGTMIVDNKTMSSEAKVVNQAIDDLEIGGLGINYWGSVITLFPQGTWGAYPKHSPEDIQSGTGYVGNSFCLKNPIKTVLRAPFTYPGQFKVPVDGLKTLTMNRKISSFLTTNSGWSLARLALHSVTGL